MHDTFFERYCQFRLSESRLVRTELKGSLSRTRWACQRWWEERVRESRVRKFHKTWGFLHPLHGHVMVWASAVIISIDINCMLIAAYVSVAEGLSPFHIAGSTCRWPSTWCWAHPTSFWWSTRPSTSWYIAASARVSGRSLSTSCAPSAGRSSRPLPTAALRPFHAPCPQAWLQRPFETLTFLTQKHLNPLP